MFSWFNFLKWNKVPFLFRQENVLVTKTLRAKNVTVTMKAEGALGPRRLFFFLRRVTRLSFLVHAGKRSQICPLSPIAKRMWLTFPEAHSVLFSGHFHCEKMSFWWWMQQLASVMFASYGIKKVGDYPESSAVAKGFCCCAWGDGYSSRKWRGAWWLWVLL